MQHIDGCIFPCPIGKFSVSLAVSELKELGFTGAVFIESKTQIVARNDFNLYPASYVTSPGIREIQKEIQGASRLGRLCMVRAGESTVNRSILTYPGVHILCDLHNAPKNAFDRVCAQIASERGVAVDLRLRPLWEQRGTARQRVIRLYEEIFLLHKRYGFPMTISSGAQTITDIRSFRSMEILLNEIGMDQKMIQASWETVPDLIRGVKPVRGVF